jgi:hypothetical protein
VAGLAGVEKYYVDFLYAFAALPPHGRAGGR